MRADMSRSDNEEIEFVERRVRRHRQGDHWMEYVELYVPAKAGETAPAVLICRDADGGVTRTELHLVSITKKKRGYE